MLLGLPGCPLTNVALVSVSNETPASLRVRSRLRAHSSSLARAEVAATVLRHLREGALSAKQASTLQTDFVKDLAAGVWTVIPVSDDFMARVAERLARMPAEAFIRAGDGNHLSAAGDGGFTEVWTNDRHTLGAAPAFSVRGRSV
jgi:hypothetical protein